MLKRPNIYIEPNPTSLKFGFWCGGDLGGLMADNICLNIKKPD